MTALADHVATSTRPTPPNRAGLPARPARPSRRHLLALLETAVGMLATAGTGRAAWQGDNDAAARWCTATGPADLDIWCDDAAYPVLADLLADLGAARVQHADDPRRLRHTSFAVETDTGLAVVDLTRGDLRVGPVLLVPADAVRTACPEGAWPCPRLAGTSAAADLFIRPLLRGRLVDGDRLELARAGWHTAPAADRLALVDRLIAQLGTTVASGIVRVLSGHDAPARLASRTRRALAVASLRPANLPSTWRQRSTVVPAGRSRGVLGLRARGCTVVLVGTDGSGKSTVASEVEQRLTAAGIRTSTAYLGMARGNLPGVALARRVLGIAPAGSDVADADRVETAPESPAAETGSAPAGHAALRRAAAWFYAVEYGYRWLRDIRPGLARGGVVICDRYVYDLRESPWPGSLASRVAERLMPRPDVLVLPDAPDAVIHARKPERPAHEQAAQQDRFRRLLAEAPARTASLRVDTSGSSSDLDPVAAVVSAVLTAQHRDH